METRIPPTPPRRGAYLLPNLFTTGGMMAGFYAIVAAIGGRYEEAVIQSVKKLTGFFFLNSRATQIYLFHKSIT